MVRSSLCLALLMLALAVACSPGASPNRAGAGESQTGAGARKTITVAALNSVKGFSPWLIGTTGGGARSLFEINTNGLVSTDSAGQFVGRLAGEMPSFENGTIVVLPDGRMETTWRLRPNITWQDGVPFTADDLVFSWRVNNNPDVPSGGTAFLDQINNVEARDPQTLLITWKTTFFRALQLDYVSFWPYPEHLLGAAFAVDRDAFLNLPYWTTDYVALGPFRLVDFGLGENLTLERFDAYFQGRPKVDRIVTRIIPDRNTLLTNLEAGSVDIATESTIGADLGALLRDKWRVSGAGVVLDKPSVWRFLGVQFNPDYGRPPELREDVRVRRGLLVATDRDALGEADLAGFRVEKDTFMLGEDPRAPLVGAPFAGYRYDPTLAAQLLAQAGWRRAADGRMLNAVGEPVRLDLRGTVGTEHLLTIIGQSWRDLGIEVVEEIAPSSLVSDRPYRATFPGLEFTGQGSGDSMLVRFDSRQCPRPPRFSGSQGGCYASADFDRLIVKLYSTIDEHEQGLVLRDIGVHMAENLPALPVYMNVSVAAVRQGIHAMVDDYRGGQGPGTASRNAHLWDRD